MYQEPEIDPRLTRWFEAFIETPPMDEQRRFEQRANFLAQAQRIELTAPREATRLTDGWVLQIKSFINDLFRGKHSLKFATALAVVFIMIIFTGGLATFAAQSNLPDQPLYPLKLWSEKLLLNASSSEQGWQLALRFAARRADEIRQLVVDEQPVPETLQLHLMSQINQALQLAVNRPDDKARQALEQVRLCLEEQNQEMVMLQGGYRPEADAALIRARDTIRERIHWAETGIQEPNRLREHFRLRLQSPEDNPGLQEQHRFGTAAPGGPNQNAAGECPNCTPQGLLNGSNPWTTVTPTPGSSYGEGLGANPWATGTPTPGSGYGEGLGANPWATGTPTPGSGYGEGLGGNPWTTGTPTPSSSYGPGPGPNPTSTPPGQGTGSGPNPATTSTPEPLNDPGSGSGPNPTNDPGDGSGSATAQQTPNSGTQPGEGKINP